MDKKLQILHLEGLESDADLVGRALKKGGLNFDRLVVDTKEKYISALRDFQPDIILSDHSLKSFNSHEALSILHESGIKIPFILVTSNMSEEFAVDVIKRGADDYLLKDRLERLPHAIHNSLEKLRLEKKSSFFLEELIKNEKYYRALVENSGDAVVIFNNKGKPTYVSPSIKRVLGFNEAEAIQFDIYGIIHPEDREAFDKKMCECISKPGIPVERHIRRVKHKNGNWIWLEGTITNMLHDQTIKGIVDNFRDITERKLAEEKIIHANRLYSFISQINHTIVHSTNETAVFREACFIAVELGKFKSAWIGLFDTTNNTINLVAEEGLMAEDIPLFSKVYYNVNGPIHHVFHTGNYFVCNDIDNLTLDHHWKRFSIERGYGSFILLPIFKSGKITGVFTLGASELNFFNSDEILLLEEATGNISFAMDVFEKDRLRTIAEQQLKSKEARLQQAQAIAHLGSWEVDFENGNSNWSEETCRIYGLSPNDDIQNYETWLSFVHPDDLEYVLKVIKEAESTLKNIGFFHRIIRKDGSIRHIYSHRQYQFGSDGKPVGVYGVAHDVTDIKESEDALRQSESKLQSIFENTNQGFILTDLYGNIISFNIRAKEFVLLNIKIEIKIGTSIFDIIEESRRENYKVNIAKILTGISLDYDHFYIREDGQKKWFHFTLNPVYHEDKIKGVCITASDITERKNTEVALKRSESRFRHIIETAQEGIWVIDENSKTTFVNKKLCEILEYSNEEMQGKEHFCFMDEEDRKDSAHRLQNRRKGIKENIDVCFITKSGKRIWTNLSASPIFDEDRNYRGSLAMVTDITERKKSEDENRFKANLLNTIGQAAIGTDVNGIVNYWNKASEKIYGWTEFEVIGRNIVDILPYESTNEQGSYIMEELKHGRTWYGEFKSKRKDGTTFPAYITVSPIRDIHHEMTGIIGIASDISEKKKLEELLNVANKLARIGSYEFDLVANTLYWSDTTREIHEVSPDFVPDLETAIQFYKAGESREAITQAVNAAIEKSISYDLELEIITAKGNECWVRAIGQTETRDGKCIRLFGSFQDIDKIKKTEIYLKELNKNLENYTKELVISNKELEQFSYIVSHNLRSPVANIIGLSEELNNDSHNPGVKKILQKELCLSVKRLDNVIVDLNNILKIKRDISEKKETVKFSELVENIESIIRNQIQKEKVEIITNFNEVNEFVTLKSYLHSIFLNLISNSIKYRRTDLAPLIQIKSEIDEEKLIITFKDNGTGIDLNKNGDQVFRLYKRFHKNVEGKGMGLFMVKTQVEILGGKITLQSEVNKGVEFKIEFII